MVLIPIIARVSLSRYNSSLNPYRLRILSSCRCFIPQYIGGELSIEDLELVKKLSRGKVDLTIRAGLDIFKGSGVKFEECVRWNEEQER